MAKVTIDKLPDGTPPPLDGSEIIPLVRGGRARNATLDELPISDATQNALDLKAPLANPTFTGSVVVPTPTTDFQASTKKYVDDGLSSVGVKTQATITANYTVFSTDENIFVDTASSITISIPDSLPLGKMFKIIRLIAGASINVDTVGAETINGANTFLFVASGQHTAVEFKKATATDYIGARQETPMVKVQARKTATQSVTGGTTNINFESEIVDTHGAWDGTTFTCPVTGWYRVSLSGFSCVSSSGTFVPYIGGSAQNSLSLLTMTNANYFDGATEIYLLQNQLLTLRCNATIGIAPLATYGGRIDITSIGA